MVDAVHCAASSISIQRAICILHFLSVLLICSLTSSCSLAHICIDMQTVPYLQGQPTDENPSFAMAMPTKLPVQVQITITREQPKPENEWENFWASWPVHYMHRRSLLISACMYIYHIPPTSLSLPPNTDTKHQGELIRLESTLAVFVIKTANGGGEGHFNSLLARLPVQKGCIIRPRSSHIVYIQRDVHFHFHLILNV